MASATPFSLELTINFNGKTIAVVPLQIPADDEPRVNADGPARSAVIGESSNAISAVLHITGNQATLQKLREDAEVVNGHLYLANCHFSKNQPGRKATFMWDGRLSSITDPIGVRTTYIYDADGSRLSASDLPPEDPEADPPEIVG